MRSIFSWLAGSRCIHIERMHSDAILANQEPIMANQHAESFLSVQLQSIVQASEKTVTLALAADVSNSVHEAAERTFHPDGHRSQATDGTEGKQRIKRFLDKISRTVSGTTENDGDDDETEQWRAIRPLTHTERETIRGLRAWGSTTPSELFTDVCIRDERSLTKDLRPYVASSRRRSPQRPGLALPHRRTRRRVALHHQCDTRHHPGEGYRLSS